MPVDPRDLVDVQFTNSDVDLLKGLDLPEFERTGDPVNDKARASHRLSLQQAYSRGAISSDEAMNAYEQEDTGIFARTLEAVTGIEASESGLQTFVDVLSLGNYAAAAMTKARHEAIRAVSEDRESGEASAWEEAAVRFLPVFSPSSFSKAFRERTMFADVFGEQYNMSAGGIGSFVMDVALDPATYLTFGTGAGAKITLKSASKVLPRILGDDIAAQAGKQGAELTLSRWGTQVHKQAVKDLLPQIEEQIVKEVAAGSTLAATRSRLLLNERAAEHMIDNYPRLAKLAWEADKRVVTKARRAMKIAAPDGFPVPGQMFQEATPLHLREIGIGGAALRRQLESIPQDKWYGNWLHGSMKVFNKTWGMDDNSRLLFGVMTDTINNERRQWTRQIAEEFKGLTDDEAKTVTSILEARLDKTAKNSADVIEHNYAPHLLEAADKAKAIFDDIAQEEQKYGVLNNVIDNYVTHMFSGDDAKIAMFQKIKKDRGLSSAGNAYSMHRQVSTISDLKAIMPDEAVEENIYNILMRRKLSSIQMVNRQKFYMEMQATHGVPASLIAQAGASIPAAYRKRMVETRDSIADVSDLTQFYAHEGISVKKWGFKEGDTEQNLRVLKWLTTGREARAVDAPWLTDHLKNYTGDVKRVFKSTFDNESREVDAMKAIRGIMTGDPFDQVPLKHMVRAIKQFDAELRKKGVGPLLGLMPDLEKMIKSGLRNPSKPPKVYKDLIAKLKEPVTGLKKAAQLPEDLITRAIQYRQKMGILTDVTKPGRPVMDDIRSMLGRSKGRGFGFEPEESKQLLDVMFNKKTLDDLTATEADRLQNFLSLHHGDASARGRYMELTGEPMVRVEFASPMGARPSAVKTNVDDVLSGLQKNREALAGRGADLNAALGKHARKSAKLERARDRLQHLNRGIGAGTVARKSIKRNTPEWRKSMGETKKLREAKRVLEEKHGKYGEINKELSKIQDLRKPVKEALIERKKSIKELRAKERLAKKHSEYLRFPTKKNKEAYDKAFKKVEGESGVSALPSAPRVFKPGGKFTEDLARPGEEVIGKGFDVERTPGTFGPFVQTAGEKVLTPDSAAYYLPKSIAHLVDGVEQNLYGPELGKLMRMYDGMQNMFKAPLMAVFPEFYMRNGVTNVALTYLKVGIGIINPVHQGAFLKTLTYVLSKEAIDITHLPKSQAAFMAYAGGASGGIIGGMQEWNGEDPSLLRGAGKVIGGTLAGALGGAAVGAGSGVAMRGGLRNIAEGGVATQTVAGGTAGALMADDHRVEGFVAGALAGGGATRLALGDGYRNLEKLAKHEIELAGGMKMTVEEMAHEAARRGVFSTFVSEEVFKQGGAKVLAMGERMGLKADVGWKEAINPVNAVFARDSFRAGELASEIPTRLMLFTIEAQRTGSLGMAAKAVKDYLFDYANLSMVERRVIKRMMPFYTWTKHALLTSADSFIQNPGRVAQSYKFINNQNLHQDVDPADYPDWLSNRLKTISVTYNPETKEKEVKVKTGYGFVQEDTMNLWHEMFGGEGRFLARGPFGFTAALEHIVDRDFFRGTHLKSKLYERSSFESGKLFQDAPPWMKQAVGYSVDPNTGRPKVDPRAAWLLTEVPMSRFFNVAKKVYSSPDNKLNFIALSRQVLGEKVYKYGPEQRLYHDRAKLDRMAMFLKNIGEIRTVQLTSPTRKKSTLTYLKR